MICRSLVVCASFLAAVTLPAFGQAPLNSDLALQPSTGGYVIREQFRSFEGDGIDGHKIVSTYVYGYRDDLTFLMTAPYLWREIKPKGSATTLHHDGLADIKALAKYHLFRDDFGPTDTRRFDAIAGLEVRSGDSGVTSDFYDPVIGGVFTHIEGRKSYHADMLSQFNTAGGLGGHDQFKYDTSHLFRLYSVRYTRHSKHAL